MSGILAGVLKHKPKATATVATAVLPESSHWQCPLCGAPVSEATVATAPTGEKGVIFDCCGNLVTLACLRDAFGIDLPY